MTRWDVVGRPPTENPGVRKRDVNDLLRQRYRADHGQWPIAFFCECADAACYRPVWLTMAAYDAARLDPAWTALGEGHEVVETVGRVA